MERALRFRLNGSLFEIVEREEKVALDWIRGEQRLTGTKEGCREGDCGACMILLGSMSPDGPVWEAALSCLLALGELDGRHVITIEGIASGGLTPVMEAMLDEGASQCGFCTPGFVVSLTGYLVSGGRITYEGAVRAIEGNLCRCTGYGSIQRAAKRLVELFGELPESLPERIDELIRAGVIPPEIGRLMNDLPTAAMSAEEARRSAGSVRLTLGGGTDHFVRNPDPEADFLEGEAVTLMGRERAMQIIAREGQDLFVGAAASIQDFFESPIVQELYPGIERHESDFASLPIRNRATLAGNITNASPIGDMTSILLALSARVRIRSSDGKSTRELPLDRFFLGYRQTALEPGDQVEALLLPVPGFAPRICFNFEKVAKRRHLDIASVNSAFLALADEEGRITSVTLSAGGVGPIPARLSKTETYLRGRRVDAQTAARAAEIAADECAPIDDVRGTADYRRALLGRFMWAHLMRLAPELALEKELMP